MLLLACAALTTTPTSAAAAGPLARAQHRVGAMGAIPMCGAREATIVGTDAPDILTGTDGPDVIVGLGGSDIIRSLGGDDTICAGTGVRDLLYAGSGDDDLYGNSGADLRGDEGDDSLIDGALRGGPGADQMLVGTGHRSPIADGGPGRDSLAVDIAEPGRTIIDLRGDGRVQSPSGALAASVTSIEATSTWTISVQPDRRTFIEYYGTAGPDLFDASGDIPVRADGRGGNDRLLGSARADSLDGGPGTDSAHGYDGRDTCVSIEVRRSCVRGPG